jgi:hypothetical protein
MPVNAPSYNAGLGQFCGPLASTNGRVDDSFAADFYAGWHRLYVVAQKWFKQAAAYVCASSYICLLCRHKAYLAGVDALLSERTTSDH